MTSDSSSKDIGELSRVGIKLFFAISRNWGLSQSEQCLLLGSPSCATLRKWGKDLDAGRPIELSNDTLERLSLIAGIQKAIEIRLPRSDWNTFIHKPSRFLGGHSALRRMLAGNISDLIAVRRYLDGMI